MLLPLFTIDILIVSTLSGLARYGILGLQQELVSDATVLCTVASSLQLPVLWLLGFC